MTYKDINKLIKIGDKFKCMWSNEIRDVCGLVRVDDIDIKVLTNDGYAYLSEIVESDIIS